MQRQVRNHDTGNYGATQAELRFGHRCIVIRDGPLSLRRRMKSPSPRSEGTADDAFNVRSFRCWSRLTMDAETRFLQVIAERHLSASEAKTTRGAHCRVKPKHSNLNFGQNRDNNSMHYYYTSAIIRRNMVTFCQPVSEI